MSFKRVDLNDAPFHQVSPPPGVTARASSGGSESNIMEVTFFIHEMSDNIFKNEGCKGDASDADNDRLVGQGKAIQKNTNFVKIRNNRGLGGERNIRGR